MAMYKEPKSEYYKEYRKTLDAASKPYRQSIFYDMYEGYVLSCYKLADESWRVCIAALNIEFENLRLAPAYETAKSWIDSKLDKDKFKALEGVRFHPEVGYI